MVTFLNLLIIGVSCRTVLGFNTRSHGGSTESTIFYQQSHRPMIFSRYMSPQTENENDANAIENNRKGCFERRTFMQRLALSTTAIVPMAISPKSTLAVDPLFAPNPLTNRALEKVRIWNQAEADNISYGGELAPGSPKGRETYAKLLVPILTMESDFNELDELLHQADGAGLGKASQILDQPKYTKIAFKKIFNAFADNIYYSDPDRANLYLGGGATPKNEQSIAYLLRNEILTNVEYLQAEVTYVDKMQQRINRGEEKEPLETEDLYDYIKKAKIAMDKYLELVPPGELKISRGLLSESKS